MLYSQYHVLDIYTYLVIGCALYIISSCIIMYPIRFFSVYTCIYKLFQRTRLSIVIIKKEEIPARPAKVAQPPFCLNSHIKGILSICRADYIAVKRVAMYNNIIIIIFSVLNSVGNYNFDSQISAGAGVSCEDTVVTSSSSFISMHVTLSTPEKGLKPSSK